MNLPLVSFRYSYQFEDGEVFTSDSTLWFREREDLESLLTGHGYRVLEVRDAPGPSRTRVRIHRPANELNRFLPGNVWAHVLRS